jgi:diguanylate cyclase (GGDEF)-like protein
VSTPAADTPRRTIGTLLGAVLLAWAAAAGAADWRERLASARHQAAVEPSSGLLQLRALREEALRAGATAERLRIDEAECRVLGDFDSAQALAVADAGLAAAGPSPGGGLREPAMRLRVCRASARVEQGPAERGLAELKELTAQPAAPGDELVHALVRMEVGIARSRGGDLVGAQDDLLAACHTLRAHADHRDADLCLTLLAGHYQRVGDAAEALKILLPLRAAARRAGETYDEAVYTFGIAQAQEREQRLDEAVESYRQAMRLSDSIGDRSVVAFAEHGIAVCLLKSKRPAEALSHAERSLDHLDPQANPRQYAYSVIAHAEALVAVGRAAQALEGLDRIEQGVNARGELPLTAIYLRTRAQALHEVGRWREAYQALSRAQVLDEDQQRQRLSDQAARLRMEFNRVRDAEELQTLRQLNEQGQRLRALQATVLVLFIVLLAALGLLARRKVRQAHQWRDLASSDELTGLPNRRAVLAFAERELAQARREQRSLAVLMIDVDHFKRINDSHGHACGDEVLRHAADRLAGSLRERDQVGRFGGEEFLAVLPGAQLADARQVAERMRAGIEGTPLARPQGPVSFTVSIGVAEAGGANDVQALIARADAALYRAKSAGRNTVMADVDVPEGA